MKIDIYTKAILTIIAICLVWLCLKDNSFVKTANASNNLQPPQPQIQQVAIAGYLVNGRVIPLISVDGNFPNGLPIFAPDMAGRPSPLPVFVSGVKDAVPVRTQSPVITQEQKPKEEKPK